MRLPKWVLLSSCVFAHVALARADTEVERAAQSLFDDAKRLIASGDFESACPKLEESERLDPRGGTLLHLGYCHMHVGKTATAYEELNEAISIARRDGRTDRVNAAKLYLASLEPKLARIRIHANPSVAILRDDHRLANGELDVAIPVDPGMHAITARAEGRKTWSTEARAVEGQTIVVDVPELELEPAPVQSPLAIVVPPPSAGPKVDLPRKTRSVLPVAGAIIVGVGSGGLVASAVVYGAMFDLASKRDAAARNGDGPRALDLHEQAKTAQLVSIAFLVGGILATGAGVTLVVLGSSRASRSASVRIAPDMALVGEF